MNLELDIAHDSGVTDDEIRAIITRAGGVVTYYNPDGPGGGNPNYRITVPDRDVAQRVIHALYGNDDQSVDLDVDTYTRNID